MWVLWEDRIGLLITFLLPVPVLLLASSWAVAKFHPSSQANPET